MSIENKPHPYHYSTDKNILQQIIDFAVPVILLWGYINYYNFGKINPSELIKTSGLFAIALLSLTLIIGPITRIFPDLNFLKAHRKFWGILSFLAALVHMGLIFVFYFKFNWSKFVDISNPKFLGLFAGLIAITILFIVTISSTKAVLNAVSPKIWKIIQTTSYLALFFAVVHFYLVESTNGVLVIKRLMGQVTFGFAILALGLRLITEILPKKK